ncbi:MAG: hypothetical protein ABIB04_01210 [Patescibacteria group bacterium]
MKFKEPRPVGEKDSSTWEKLKKSRIAKTLIVATALHSPLFPRDVQEPEKTRQEIIHEIEEKWKKPDTIIRPQSDEARQEVIGLTKKRSENIDKDQVKETKKEFRERMEKGEKLKFRDIYFQMERVNGIDEEIVVQAESIANSVIEKYAQASQGELPDALIRRIVTEMYGPSKNYKWGQGSVSRYFVSGERNCVAISKAELIVFEGVIERLNEIARKRYELGLRMVKQHEIATLGLKTPQTGGVSRLFLLEPPPRIETNAEDRTGTADIGLDFLKQGLISDKPLTVQAIGADHPERIPDSPSIDAIVDQPVSNGISVSGKLRGSDFVRNQARKEEIVPEVTKKDKDIMDLEILELDPGKEVFLERWTKNRTFGLLDLRDFTAPSPESLHLGWDTGPRPRKILLPDVSLWSEEAINEALHRGTNELSVQTNRDGRLPETFIKALMKNAPQKTTKMGDEENLGLQFFRLSIDTVRDDSNIAADEYAHIPPDQLKRIADAIRLAQWDAALVLPYTNLSKDELEIIHRSKLRKIYFPNMHVFTFANVDISGYQSKNGPVILMKIPNIENALAGMFETMPRFLPDIEHMNENELVAAIEELGKLKVLEPASPKPGIESLDVSRPRRDDIEAAYKAAEQYLRFLKERKKGKLIWETGNWSSYINKFADELEEYRK